MRSTIILITIILNPLYLLAQDEKKLSKKEANEEVRRLTSLVESLQLEKEELNNKLMIEYEKLLSEMDQNSNLRNDNGELREQTREMLENLMNLEKKISNINNSIGIKDNQINEHLIKIQNDSILINELYEKIYSLKNKVTNDSLKLEQEKKEMELFFIKKNKKINQPIFEYLNSIKDNFNPLDKSKYTFEYESIWVDKKVKERFDNGPFFKTTRFIENFLNSSYFSMEFLRNENCEWNGELYLYFHEKSSTIIILNDNKGYKLGPPEDEFGEQNYDASDSNSRKTLEFYLFKLKPEYLNETSEMENYFWTKIEVNEKFKLDKTKKYLICGIGPNCYWEEFDGNYDYIIFEDTETEISDFYFTNPGVKNYDYFNEIENFEIKTSSQGKTIIIKKKNGKEIKINSSWSY